MRPACLVATALSAWVACGTASAAPRTTVDFAGAPLGPKSAFHAFVKMPHPGSRPIALTARSRRVATIHWNGERALLVAPIRGGGFCTSLSGPYGGSSCRQHRGALDPGLVGDASGPVALNGVVTDPRTARLELRYEDGSRANLKLIWVTAPISAGFFVFPIAHVHRATGRRPLSLSSYSASGTRLAVTRLH